MTAHAMRRPFLTGKQIYLRHVEPSDLNEEYLRWLNDPEVTRHLVGTGQFPSTPESLQAYYRRFESGRTDLLFAIVDRSIGRHIGNVTLNNIHPIHRTADTGLIIGSRAHWGRGIATEVWRLIATHAFRRLGLRKLIAGAVAENAASIGALKRVGFQVEGRLRAEVFMDGAARDVLRLGLLSEEFVLPQPPRQQAGKTLRRSRTKRQTMVAA